MFKFSLMFALSNCQNPKSTISSIQLSLRLNYIHIERSTTTTQTQLVYSKLGRADHCPASKEGPVCTSVQSGPVQQLCTTIDSRPDKRIFNFFVSEFKINQRERSSGYQLIRKKFKIILSGKKQSRTTGPDFIQM